MKIERLVEQIRKKNSFLCVGLDVDLEKVPEHILDEDDPIFAFNKAIIDATHEFCVSYKPNIAFYEAHGLKGWQALNKTISYLNDKCPDHFTIADAKRGDIGNTSSRYAKAFFEEMEFDSITVAPYMGKDSVEPFLEYDDKHTILLALTSNIGAFDYQTKSVGDRKLYEEVISISREWKNAQQLMYVIGATKAEYLAEVRKLIPDSFLLVPGVGAQGGSLEKVCEYGMNEEVGLLVNSSRGILYASQQSDFAEAAAQKARELQNQMEEILKNY